MSLLKVLAILLGVLVLSACGSSRSAQPAGEPQTTTKVSPPIEAIDEPAPDAGWSPLPDSAGSSSSYLCLGDEATGDRKDDCPPPPDVAEHLRQMEAEFERAVQPAKGTEPRAIAQLRLPTRGRNARARFITWRNQSGKLCVEMEEEDENGGGGGGPSGPCVPGGRCSNLCLELSGSSGSDAIFAYLLSGLVASEADDLRITFDDGHVQDYGLTGPVVPGFPKSRVFMLDLGRDLYRRLELRRDGKVIAEERVPDAQIRMMRCEDSGPPALPTQDGQTRHADRCLERAAPK